MWKFLVNTMSTTTITTAHTTSVNESKQLTYHEDENENNNGSQSQGKECEQDEPSHSFKVTMRILSSRFHWFTDI